MDKFHLFPLEVHAAAQQVDWLFFGLTHAAFLCVVVFCPDRFFRVQLSARLERRPLQSFQRFEFARKRLDHRAVAHGPGVLRLGRGHYYHMERPPAERLAGQRRGQTMDVETAACGRDDAKSTSCMFLWGATVTLTMTSQDVIHSFYVPAFRVKQDVLPGRYTTEWFNPTSWASSIFFAPSIAGPITPR